MKDQTLQDHEKLIKKELKLGIELHMELEREDACDKILKLIHKQNKALLKKERERVKEEAMKWFEEHFHWGTKLGDDVFVTEKEFGEFIKQTLKVNK